MLTPAEIPEGKNKKIKPAPRPAQRVNAIRYLCRQFYAQFMGNLISMTGFGKAKFNLRGRDFTTEIRTLNSKQFDLNLRLPGLLKTQEAEIRQLLSQNLFRGKVDVSIYAEQINNSGGEAELNTSLLTSYFLQLKQAAGIQGVNTSEGLFLQAAQLPGVWVTREEEPLNEEEWNKLKHTLVLACEEVNTHRATEGERLQHDILQHVSTIDQLRQECVGYFSERAQNIRQRLLKALQDISADVAVDHNRLEQEMIYYLEKLDLNEENIRLGSHLAYFKEIVESSGEAGRKLGFVSQEMGREINTMGSKANHAGIQRKVVEMKDELEKIKEQLLNVL